MNLIFKLNIIIKRFRVEISAAEFYTKSKNQFSLLYDEYHEKSVFQGDTRTM